MPHCLVNTRFKVNVRINFSIWWLYNPFILFIYSFNDILKTGSFFNLKLQKRPFFYWSVVEQQYSTENSVIWKKICFFFFLHMHKGKYQWKNGKKQNLVNYLIWERYISFHKLQYILHHILEGFSKIISTSVRIDPWSWPYKHHNFSLWNKKFSTVV